MRPTKANEATLARAHECKQAERGHAGPIASLATGSESGQNRAKSGRGMGVLHSWPLLKDRAHQRWDSDRNEQISEKNAV